MKRGAERRRAEWMSGSLLETAVIAHRPVWHKVPHPQRVHTAHDESAQHAAGHFPSEYLAAHPDPRLEVGDDAGPRNESLKAVCDPLIRAECEGGRACLYKCLVVPTADPSGRSACVLCSIHRGDRTPPAGVRIRLRAGWARARRRRRRRGHGVRRGRHWLLRP